MPQTFWIGNAALVAQLDTLTVTVVANGGTISTTINTKTVTYTMTATDTTTTSATGLFNLLNAAKVLMPEYGELTFANPSAGVITVTASTAGTPFTMTIASGGGATMTQVHTTTNGSPSDVNNANNWQRSGAPSLPQNGDDVVLTNSSVPLLWNLSSLSAVQFNTLTVWMDFTGTVGLPENNPLGYEEYRPTYFQFTGPPAGTLKILLGEGTIGTGPGRQRYNVGGQLTALNIVNSGVALDNYAVRFLGTNTGNTVTILGSSLGIAMLTGETANLTSATVDGNATLALGSGCSITGTLQSTGGNIVILTNPGTLDLRSGSVCQNQSTGLTFTTVKLSGGSSIAWTSDSSITTLTMLQASLLDKSADMRTVTFTNTNMDGDCVINDPNGTITFTNATSITNTPITSGLITRPFGGTVKIT